MRETSALYKRLISSANHYFEFSVVIGDKGSLITKTGEKILFGGVAILVDRGGADAGYGMGSIVELSTKQSIFKSNTPSIGNTIAGEISLKMISPSGEIPRMAQIVPYVRCCAGDERSEWLQMGLYYCDTREVTSNGDGLDILTIHGYDQMLLTEQSYPSTTHDFPCSDLTALNDISAAAGFEVDPRTLTVVTGGYTVEVPSGYTCRDTLGYIASLYGGNFIFNDDGLLQLIQFGSIQRETRYLIDESGYTLTFGGDRVIV